MRGENQLSGGANGSSRATGSSAWPKLAIWKHQPSLTLSVGAITAAYSEPPRFHSGTTALATRNTLSGRKAVPRRVPSAPGPSVIIAWKASYVTAVPSECAMTE